MGAQTADSAGLTTAGGADMNVTECKACQSTSLTWFTQNATFSGVQQGRLRTSEVTCQFVLGCDYCSETLAVISADKVADLLNSRANRES